PLLVGWVWFVVALLPTIGLVQSGTQARADRFTYFPAIGLTAGIVFLWPKEWLGGNMVGRARLVAASLVLAASIYMTLQLSLWRDPYVLYQYSNHHAGESATLDFALGYELQKEGYEEKAMEQYQRAIRLAPRYGAVHNNMGMMMLRRG